MRPSSPFSFLYSCVQAVLGRAPQSGRRSQAISLRKWIARAVALVLLAGSASLFAALHKSAAENGKPDPPPKAAATATKAKSASPSAERNSKPGGAPASKPKEEKKSGEPAEAANAANTPAAAPPQQLTPSLVRPDAEENGHEGADLVRRRQEWFYSQRAYPNAKIPAGARQRALEQRDRMVGQPLDVLQPSFLAAPPVGPGAQQFGIIPLPGDGTWHLISPPPLTLRLQRLS